MFSIVIPTFNNIEYLKLCLESLKKNSKYNHQIIIFINEGNDGTLSYVKEKNIEYIHSPKNVGLCIAVNKAANLAKNDYIMYSHDDMYFCPGWDEVFYNEIKKHSKNKDFYLSGTMIQPFDSFININCGKSIDQFDENKLLKEFNKIKFSDYQGSTWAPHLIPTKTWRKIDGFSEEYTYGIGSDPDLCMKLWQIGVRLFKGLGDCRVYHFGSISLRKKVYNEGHKIFLLKWGITAKFFKRFYLNSDKIFKQELNSPKINTSYIFNLIVCKLKYIYLKITFPIKN